MEIIVKKYGDSQHFRAHHNRELGKTYHDKRTYLSDMKKAGLEPYDPKSVKKTSPSTYKQSEWAKGMLADVSSRKGRKPGDRFVKELEKRGYSQKSADKARDAYNRSQNGR